MRRTNSGAQLACRLLALAAAFGLAASSASCATLRPRRFAEHPVTVTEVVILSEHGVPPEKIVAKMRRAGTIYQLSDKQYAALRKKGVTPAVIAYMQAARAEAEREFPKLADDKDMNCWNLGFDGYWYAGGPWGLHPDC